MMQIILNYLVIIIIPFLSGAFIRFLFSKRAKGWIVTVVFACLSLAALIIAVAVPNYGSELNGLLAVMAACLLLGSLLTAGIIKIRQRKK